jgi:hypothetical protein
LLAGDPDRELAARTVVTPNNGQRTVTARRFRIAGDGDQSLVLLSLIDDRTDQAKVAEVAG